MANETKKKRPPGRPAGREFTHHFRVPMTPQMRDALAAAAADEGRPAAAIVRALVDRWLKRR